MELNRIAWFGPEGRSQFGALADFGEERGLLEQIADVWSLCRVVDRALTFKTLVPDNPRRFLLWSWLVFNPLDGGGLNRIEAVRASGFLGTRQKPAGSVLQRRPE